MPFLSILRQLGLKVESNDMVPTFSGVPRNGISSTARRPKRRLSQTQLLLFHLGHLNNGCKWLGDNKEDRQPPQVKLPNKADFGYK